MDIKISISVAGVFRRIHLSVSEKNSPVDCELSGIIKDPTGREEIFLPSPEKMVHNASYPSSGGRFATCTGKGTYQIIFQPKERGKHELKIIGRASGKPFQKVFQIAF